MTKDRRLGKGLAALLGTPVEGEPGYEPVAPSDAQVATAGNSDAALRSSDKPSNSRSKHAPTGDSAEDNDDGVRLLELSVYEIDNNPFQPRRQFNPDEIASLAESLKSHQQLQPLLVRRAGDRYELISGERRLRAAIHAGMATVRAEIRDADDRLVAELAIIENLQRKDLNAVEKALSFRRYIDEHGCKQDELASRLKIDRSTIANLMRLLELPEDVLDAIQQERLTAGHARALLPLGDETEQRKLAKTIADESWSVRQTESHVSELLQEEDDIESGASGAATAKKRKSATSPQVSALERQLRMDLGTKVEIKQSTRGKGKIVVHFANADEFERIRDAMTGESSLPRVAAA